MLVLEMLPKALTSLLRVQRLLSSIGMSKTQSDLLLPVLTVYSCLLLWHSRGLIFLRCVAQTLHY